MKAWALRRHRQAPQFQAAAKRGFRSRSRVVEDNRSEPAAQRAAFGLIKHSARVLAQRQALDALRDSPRMVAQRTAFASMFHRPTAAGSQSSVIQLYQVLRSSYTPKTGGRAGVSELDIRLDGVIGGPGHNNPVSPQTWLPGRDDIRSKYALRENEPFAMHLVNGRLGGSGRDIANLAWGSHNFNDKHCRNWEVFRQNDALTRQNAGCVMKMSVSANYKSDDPTSDDFRYLNTLRCSHSLLDRNGGVIDASQDVMIDDTKDYEEADESFESDDLSSYHSSEEDSDEPSMDVDDL
jgi:hypothetical protein